MYEPQYSQSGTGAPHAFTTLLALELRAGPDRGDERPAGWRPEHLQRADARRQHQPQDTVHHAGHERVTLSGEATTTLRRLFYNIDQAKDAATNPYDANGTSTTGLSVRRDLATMEEAGYATMEEAGYGRAALTLPSNVRLTLAARAQQWTFGSNFVVTPRASLSVPLGWSHILSFGMADYAQMPTFLYLLLFPQNQAPQPIRARHLTTAVTLVDSSRVRIALAAYRKTYRDYPVSAQLPQLSLANVGDTFGQAFLMFPMLSRGLGRADGAELSLDLKPISRLTITANLAYSRTRFSGLDGVYRNSSADLPLVANLAAVGRLGHGLTVFYAIAPPRVVLTRLTIWS